MIIFAKPRHHYDSYRDYWRLVELSEFRTCFVDEIEFSAAHVYILNPWNGEVDALPAKDRRARQAKLIWWNGERPDVPGVPSLHDMVDRALRIVDQVWVSDRYYQSLDPRQDLVTMGSHPGLALQHGTEPLSIERSEHDYDYAHASYIHGRRSEIHGLIRALDLREAPAGYDPERDRSLRRSKVLISTHQTPISINEPLRWCLAAAYKLPLVSEHLADPFPLVRGESYYDAAMLDLAKVVRELAAPGSQKLRRHLGNAIHRVLCVEHSFRYEVERAVKRCG